jgi:hypothetical protein
MEGCRTTKQQRESSNGKGDETQQKIQWAMRTANVYFTVTHSLHPFLLQAMTIDPVVAASYTTPNRSLVR